MEERKYSTFEPVDKSIVVDLNQDDDDEIFLNNEWNVNFLAIGRGIILAFLGVSIIFALMNLDGSSSSTLSPEAKFSLF